MCMLSTEDLKQISGKGITEEQVKNQLEDFKKGFPFLKIDAAASVGNGVVAPADDMRKQYIEAWNNYKAGRIFRPVPQKDKRQTGGQGWPPVWE